MSLNAIRAAGRPKLDVDTILSHWLSFAVLLTIIAIYYLFLLSNGTFQLFGPEILDKAFDNMLVHLLRGEFTVDREAIGYKVFTRDGKTYAYFGIFPAVLYMLAGNSGRSTLACCASNTRAGRPFRGCGRAGAHTVTMSARKRAIHDAAERLAPDLKVWRQRNHYFHDEDARYLQFLIQPGVKVLELGCGNGDLLASLRPSDGVGVDFSAATLALARQRHPH